LSDDQTIRGGARRRDHTALGSALGLGVAFLILIGFVALAERDVSSSPQARPAGQPSTSEGVATVPAATPTQPAPTQPVPNEPVPTEPVPTEPVPTEPAPTEPAPTEPAPSPSTGQPSDADATAFITQYETVYGEDSRSLASDLDADGSNELVLARITDGVAMLDVARWSGEGYEVVYNDEAANADRLDSLVARDLNGELGAEIVLVHSLGEFGNSLTVWGARGDNYRPQPARGGCWDGSNTYGITGAVIEDGSITATCDGSLLPRAAWPSDVYVWVDGRWTYQRTQAPQP
jgi:hypothetical protein